MIIVNPAAAEQVAIPLQPKHPNGSLDLVRPGEVRTFDANSGLRGSFHDYSGKPIPFKMLEPWGLILVSGQDAVFAIREIRICGEPVAGNLITPQPHPALVAKLQTIATVKIDDGATFVLLTSKSDRFIPLKCFNDEWEGIEITVRNKAGDGNGLPSPLRRQAIVATDLIQRGQAFDGLLLCSAVR